MQAGIDKLRADYLSGTNFDEIFKRYTTLYDMVKSLTTQMQGNLDRLDVIYQVFINFIHQFYLLLGIFRIQK